MKLSEFLNKYNEALRQKIAGAFTAVYDPRAEGEKERAFRERLAKLLRQPFPKQVEAVLSLAKGFHAGHRGLFLVAEMGTGKSMMGICASYLVCGDRSRTLVLCPGHLVDKWKREIRQTVPQAVVVDLNGPGLHELIALKNKPVPKGREFYIVGKERAKNHFTRKTAVAKRLSAYACPACGERLSKMPSVDGKRPLCPNCRSPLWEADRNKFRRFAKSEFIKRHLPPGVFQFCIADEVHQYKAGDSAQGQAFANLICSARYTLCLTGTLSGGYSTNLFYLLYRLAPGKMKEICDYKNSMAFAERYGIIERIEKEDLRDNAASIGRNNVSRRIRERPGVSPLVFTDLLLERCVFLKLDDVARNLPPYHEKVIEVAMGHEQQAAYAAFEDDLMLEVRSALAAGDRSLLGAMINSLLAYPDGARRGEIVVHPRKIDPLTGEKLVVCTAPCIDEPLLAKEEQLLSILSEEHKQGRKTMVCLEHTGTRDLIPDLKERIENIGLSVLVLRQNHPTASQRETWLQARMEEKQYDVLITNPRLIETGLDLLEFPSIVFFQTGYSVFTLRQAGRRSWRIGQTAQVRVYYLVYADTMQAVALSLMADKMQVALAVEGDLSDKGLTALAEGDTSLLIKMAKSLLGEEVQQSAEDKWRGLADATVRADDRLDDPASPVLITQTTTITTDITAHRPDNTPKEISVIRVIRGKVYPHRGFAVAIIADTRAKLLFLKGRIFHNQQEIGEYDAKGNGRINGKTIQLLPDGDIYLLIELKQSSPSQQAA
ncbi:MAG: SNF2-related protein [Thermodesulfobacteriota bacterium]